MKVTFTTYLYNFTTTSSKQMRYMSVIDDILWLLRDGEVHDLEEVREKVALSKLRIEIAFNFLREYDFIQLDTKARRIRLKPSILEFINRVQYIEEEDRLSH